MMKKHFHFIYCCIIRGNKSLDLHVPEELQIVPAVV